jgi:hypothetical protein
MRIHFTHSKRGYGRVDRNPSSHADEMGALYSTTAVQDAPGTEPGAVVGQIHPQPGVVTQARATSCSCSASGISCGCSTHTGVRLFTCPQDWKVLARLHCCPHRATALLAEIFVLQLVEEQRKSGETAHRLGDIGGLPSPAMVPSVTVVDAVHTASLVACRPRAGRSVAGAIVFLPALAHSARMASDR